MQRMRVLPPPPSARSWLSAGLCAGLLFALAELVAAPLSRLRLGPAAALAIAAADVVWVGGLVALTGLAIAVLGRRPLHSEGVGISLAPILAASVMAPALLAWRTGPEPVAALGVGVAVGLLIALAAGTLAALGGSRLERSGYVLAGPPVWLGASLLAAASAAARARPDTSLREATGLLIAALVIGSLGALSLLRDSGTASPRRLGRGAAGAAAALGILILVARPWVVPWLTADAAQNPAPASAPPLVVVALGPLPGAWPEALELLSVSAIDYVQVHPRDGRGAGSLLNLPDGASLVSLLEDRGYVTASFAVEDARGLAAETEHRDARRGPRRQLEDAAAQTTGAAVLLAAGEAVLAPLGLNREWRAPRAVVDAALAWSTGTRLRPGAPPFLVVIDLRPPRHRSDAAADSRDRGLGDALERLVTRLGPLGLGTGATWLVAVEGNGHREPLRVLLRPPPGRATAVPGERHPAPTQAGRVAERVLSLLARERQRS